MMTTTKIGNEQAFRLALQMAERRYDLQVIATTLIHLESLSEDDAIRIADHALICLHYERMNAN
jgi:hypothetical protein